MTDAYILDMACTALGEQPIVETDLGTALFDTVCELTESAKVRSADIHDVVFGYASDGHTGTGDVLARLNTARLRGCGITAYHVDRGIASGLQAIGLATYAVLSGQQDLVIAAGGSVQESRQLAVGAAMISGERFVARNRRRPRARIRHFATAGGYGGPAADAITEAAIRLLMNETLTIGDVDLWEIYDDASDLTLDVTFRLGIEVERVNLAGGVAVFSDAGAAAPVRSAAVGLGLMTQRGLRTCVVLAPGPGDTGTALLLENAS